MKIIDNKGREFEWLGEYRQPAEGEWFLSGGLGGVGQAQADGPPYRELAIIHPIPKRHFFGGVVFEETGEVREPRDEWGMIDGGPYPEFFHEYPINVRILRPVEVMV